MKDNNKDEKVDKAPEKIEVTEKVAAKPLKDGSMLEVKKEKVTKEIGEG